jgi:hypothetical protein
MGTDAGADEAVDFFKTLDFLRLLKRATDG